MRNAQPDSGDVVHERALCEVDAENLRDLVDDDHHRNAGLEADQHRLGNEIGDEAEAEDRCQDQNSPHHHRQQRRRVEQRSGIAARHGFTELCGRQDCKRRAGTDAQWSRRAEHCIDDHRHERGIEAHLNRQACDGGIRHRLRNDDRGRRESRHDIGTQPLAPVVAEPFEHHR